MPFDALGPRPPVPLDPGALPFEIAARTDPGRERDLNEDALHVESAGSAHALIRGQVLVVADGMGGHAAGEVASALAVDAVRAAYYASRSGSIAESLQEAIDAAGDTIQRAAREDPDRVGMGCTIVAAVIHAGSLVVAHVGDSRAYLVRQGRAMRLTRDHSWVEGQVDAGILTHEEADQHPDRNVLLRALGRQTVVEADVMLQQLMPGDAVVLCSDGLTGVVDDAEIAAHASQLPPRACTEQLIALANRRGAPDNVTVIVAGSRHGRAAGAGSSSWRIPILVAGVALAVVAMLVTLLHAASSEPVGVPAPSPADAGATATAAVPIAAGTGALVVTPSPSPSPRLPEAPAATATGASGVSTDGSRSADTGMRTAVVTEASGAYLRGEPTASRDNQKVLLQPGSRLHVRDEVVTPSDHLHGCPGEWRPARTIREPVESGYVCGTYLSFPDLTPVSAPAATSPPATPARTAAPAGRARLTALPAGATSAPAPAPRSTPSAPPRMGRS